MCTRGVARFSDSLYGSTPQSNRLRSRLPDQESSSSGSQPSLIWEGFLINRWTVPLTTNSRLPQSVICKDGPTNDINDSKGVLVLAAVTETMFFGGRNPLKTDVLVPVLWMATEIQRLPLQVTMLLSKLAITRTAVACVR